MRQIITIITVALTLVCCTSKQGQRQTAGETNGTAITQTNAQTNAQTIAQTIAQTNTQTNTQTITQTNAQTNAQTNTQTNAQTNTQTITQTNAQTNAKADELTNNQSDMNIIPEEYKSSNLEGMQRTCDFIKGCGQYFIATVEGDQPRVRPFGTIHIFEDKLYIQTGHVKNVAKQIAANGKVELCAFNGSDWVRLSGTLVEDPRVEAKKSMLDANPTLRSMYSETDDNTAVYFFTNATADFCSFTKDKETINF